MNEDEKSGLALDLAEMVRAGYLIAYVDTEGLMRFVHIAHAQPIHLRNAIEPGQVWELIMSGECE